MLILKLHICPQGVERCFDPLVLSGTLSDAIHDCLNTLKILLLLEDYISDLGHSLLILIVIVLESVDDFSITEGDQTILEHGKVV